MLFNRDATELLSNINGIATVFLSADDVVRHRLVKEIIKAYHTRTADQKDDRKKEEIIKQEDEDQRTLSEVMGSNLQ